MAYNQPDRYEAPPRPYYGHQDPQYAARPYARPRYALPQQYGQEGYYNGMSEQGGGYDDQNRYDERSQYPGQQYGSQHEGMNRGAQYQEQQRDDYIEAAGYREPRNQGPSPSRQYPPEPGYQAAPMSQSLPRPGYPTNYGHNVTQRQQPQQQLQQQPQYSRSNTYYGGPSQQATGGYHRQDGYREPEGRQPQLQGSYRNESGYPDDGNQRPAPDDRTQERIKRSQERAPQIPTNGYVSNDMYGNAGRADLLTVPHSTQSPKVMKAQPIKPVNERIFGGPSSPETLSWDNPFPTFPVNKKKAAHSEAESLNGNLAGMSLRRDAARREGSPDKRPETASSKSSHASSRSHERHNGGASQDHHDGPRPHPPGNSNLADAQQYGPAQIHQNTQRTGHESRGPQPGPAQWRNNGDDRSFGQPVQDSRPFNNNQRLDQMQTASYSSAEAAFGPGQQRSRTMPNGIAKAYTNPALQVEHHGQPAWSEPSPIAGYRGPEGRGYLPNAPITSSDRTPVAPRGPKSNEHLPSHSHGAQKTAGPVHRPPHYRQASYGELFDSYCDMPQDNQLTHTRSGGSYCQPSFEEDMPNFDAMSDEGSGHKRGMTIDRHLRAQGPQRAPEIPAVPVYSYNDNAMASYSHPDFAGQVHRSRSQPDLRDYRQPKGAGNDGFNFGVAGEVRNAASVPPRTSDVSPQSRSYSDPRYKRAHYDNPASSRNGQHQVYPARIPNGEARGAGLPQDNMARFPNGGAGENGQPQVGSQNNGQVRQYVPPGLGQKSSRDNQRSAPGQERSPGTGPSPTGRTGPTLPPTGRPSNPDALPAHPAPVRPGLVQAPVPTQAPKPSLARQYDRGPSSVQPAQGSIPNQAPKPVPVRQYDGVPSTLQQPSLTPQAVPPGSSKDGRASVPVTLEELERIRQAIKANPSDQKTQLVLAKKMVEAAAVLADEGGRADQKTKNKNREKYIFDAHKLVKKLVYNGYPDAMFYLADCHGRGLLGLEPDTKEAFNLYQSAAKAGHAQSAYRVAVCCEMGQEEGGGTRRDHLKAIQWYKRAATLGDTPAMYKMGMIQLKGLLGQPKNPREAVDWLKRAADRADEENPHALHELGLLYETASGNDNIIKDEVYSKQLFTQAADLGYKFSQYRLGCAYEYGLMGCPINPRQSIAWYSRAAVQEEHQSELALSGWYLTGSEGVLQQSDTEAYLWARKAAQAGLAKAEYAMGYFTEVGIGAPANIEDAKRWYWRAASQNFPKARERLEDLRKGGPKMQKSRVISRSAVDRRSDGECSVM